MACTSRHERAAAARANSAASARTKRDRSQALEKARRDLEEVRARACRRAVSRGFYASHPPRRGAGFFEIAPRLLQRLAAVFLFVRALAADLLEPLLLLS